MHLFPAGAGQVVSIHAPAWGATWPASSGSCREVCFNPRTRVGCDSCLTAWHRRSSCFNPRTRVGCDRHTAAGVNGNALVSIHAPAWGATTDAGQKALEEASFNPRTRVGCDGGDGDSLFIIQIVSIHAPAWGATCRHRETHQPSRVSIHAPAWGATRLSDKWVTGMMGFNPRTRVGCDNGISASGDTMTVFQSTHPRGVRRRRC